VEEYIYVNNTLVPISEARISPLDRGFLYGDGLFETIRVNRGRPLFLKDHLERIESSCSAFNICLDVDPIEDWYEKIERVIAANNLGDGLAAVKILVTRGTDFPEPRLPKSQKPTVIIYARSYNPPSSEKYNKGLKLITFPHRRHTKLADYKSLNYLFYLAAKEWAVGKGGDEALILNGDGTVSEGSTTNIFYVKDGKVYKPISAHYLRGIMEKQVIKFLETAGVEVKEKETYIEDLLEADELFLTNSLIEVIPAYSIDGKVLSRKGNTIRELVEMDWGRIANCL